MEGLGRAHRVLTGQAVRHQKGLDRRGDARDFRRFAHHRLVQSGATGGVEDEDVEAAQPRRVHRPPCDIRRRLPGHDGQGLDPRLHAQRRELLHRRRPAGVEGRHQDLLAVGLGEAHGELRRGGGLARALQTRHQDHGRRVDGEVDPLRLFPAQHVDQSVVDDLYDLLAGLDRTEHRLTGCAFAGLGDEVLDNRQGDVGVQQGQTNLAQGLVNVLFRQHAATGQPVKDACQSFA